MNREDIIRMAHESHLDVYGLGKDYAKFADAIERFAALVASAAIKEALAQPEQEPVAWMFQHEETGRMMFVETQQLEWGFEKGNLRLKKIGPLYTTPLQRKPLTDEEIYDMYNEPRSDAEMIAFARAIEAAHGIKGLV